MSVGLRVLVVMLLGFVAIWSYRLRLPLLERALYGAVFPSTVAADGYQSPVESLVSPQVRLTLEGNKLPFETSPPDILNREPPWTPAFFAGEELAFAGDEQGSYDAFLILPDEAPERPEPQRQEDRSQWGDEPVRAPGGPEGSTAPASVGEVRYRVVDGDSLWKIAERFLGSGTQVGVIEGANAELLRRRGGRDRLRPGDELRIPIFLGAEESLKNLLTGADSSVEESSVSQRADSNPRGETLPPEVPVLHRVGRDENLTKIAKLYFPGDFQGWERIFAANPEQLASPDLVREGMLLKVPVEAPGDSGSSFE